MFANPTANPQRAAPTNLSPYLDLVLGNTRGSIIERGSAGWTKVAPSATSGLPWVSNGAGADPSYRAVTNAALPSPLSSMNADSLIGNFTGSAAAPGQGALVNCSNALIYSTSTHAFGCNATAGTGTVTSVATAGLATGGTITSTGTVTVTAAAKSDQQSASSSTLAVTPSQQQSHPSALKAVGYATISGTTLTDHSPYNGTFARNSTGTYIFTFTTAFANTNYSCTAMAEHATLTLFAQGIPAGRLVGSFEIQTLNTSGTPTDAQGIDLSCAGGGQ
jgi:hypothetical protein